MRTAAALILASLLLLGCMQQENGNAHTPAPQATPSQPSPQPPAASPPNAPDSHQTPFPTQGTPTPAPSPSEPPAPANGPLDARGIIRQAILDEQKPAEYFADYYFEINVTGQEEGRLILGVTRVRGTCMGQQLEIQQGNSFKMMHYEAYCAPPTVDCLFKKEDSLIRCTGNGSYASEVPSCLHGYSNEGLECNEISSFDDASIFLMRFRTRHLEELANLTDDEAVQGGWQRTRPDGTKVFLSSDVKPVTHYKNAWKCNSVRYVLDYSGAQGDEQRLGRHEYEYCLHDGYGFPIRYSAILNETELEAKLLFHIQDFRPGPMPAGELFEPPPR